MEELRTKTQELQNQVADKEKRILNSEATKLDIEAKLSSFMLLLPETMRAEQANIEYRERQKKLLKHQVGSQLHVGLMLCNLIARMFPRRMRSQRRRISCAS